jgi:anti-sigma regulatory factor (Ser/Thr protein kinase)
LTERRTFPAEASSVAQAREFVASAAGPLDGEEFDLVRLMTSELASNSVRHATSAFEVHVVRTGGDLRVEVTDHGTGRPELLSPGPDVPSGRGLRIVDLFSTEWGFESIEPAGKTVWFRLAIPVTAS